MYAGMVVCAKGQVNGSPMLSPTPELLFGLAVSDVLNGGGDDGSGVLGMAEFEVHAAAYVLQLEHGASPGGAGDGDLDGLGTEFRMAGEKSFATAQKHGGVAMIQSLNLENCGRREIAQIDTTLDFRLDDAAVHVVGQIGVGAKHGGIRG
jgi:hypothetical protein